MPLKFVIFRGGRPCPPPPLDPLMDPDAAVDSACTYCKHKFRLDCKRHLLEFSLIWITCKDIDFDKCFMTYMNISGFNFLIKCHHIELIGLCYEFVCR